MANTSYTGTTNDPVQLDPWQQVVGFKWGGNIGVLIIDFPEGIRFNFDPLFSSYMINKRVGDIIGIMDFARFNDTEPAPISFLVRDKIILSTLYGEGDRKWVIRRLIRSAGMDPGNHVSPSPFPPDEGLQPNSFPNLIWQEYKDFYEEQRTRFFHDHPEGRWIEVADLKSFGDDTLVAGPAQTLYGPGETWDELHYGEVALYHFELVPYDPPRYNIFFVQQYNTILANPDGRAPGNIGYAPYGFNPFEAVKLAPFGIGEEEVAGNPGRKAIRQIYFFDFNVIDKPAVPPPPVPAPKPIISVSMTGNEADDKITSGYNVRFRFQLFSSSTKFTLTENSVTGNPPGTYDQQQIFPYTQTGTLFRIDDKGFV
jgi:hypothetical protein